KIQVRSQTEHDSQGSELETGLVLAAIGYRGRAPAELPFDEARGVIPSQGGRVLNGADALPGAYVTGWIRRGPRGIIGSNKKCARDCVRALMADARAGKLPRQGTLDASAVFVALSACAPELNSYEGWRAIDRYERAQGAAGERPRLKLTRWNDLLECAAAP
ncbi:MAG: NADP oxidoreductase, partial [Salinisphaera sp.]|nr:NADP oxidoreductase [Salinisphaera sp.]